MIFHLFLLTMSYLYDIIIINLCILSYIWFHDKILLNFIYVIFLIFLAWQNFKFNLGTRLIRWVLLDNNLNMIFYIDLLLFAELLLYDRQIVYELLLSCFNFFLCYILHFINKFRVTTFLISLNHFNLCFLQSVLRFLST